MTKPERLLWFQLRANRMGFHVKSQHAVEGYFLDFYVHAAKLCIEVDGSEHSEQVEYDEFRGAKLAEHGILTVRLSATSVLKNPAGMARYLYTIMCERSSEDPLGWND